RRHTRSLRDWSSDVCSSELTTLRRQVVRMQVERPCNVASWRRETPGPLHSGLTSVTRPSRGLPTVPSCPILPPQNGFSWSTTRRSEERRVGKEGGVRWERYH